MPDFAERVDDVLEDYVKRKGGRKEVAEIYERLYSDYDPEIGAHFPNFEVARETFSEKDWSEENFEKFINAVHEVLDGGAGTIPESYFIITEPNDLTVERATRELEEKPYHPEAPPGTERDGFQYDVDGDGVIHATWHYTHVNRSLTGVGKVEKTYSEESIRFRIHPTENLLVVETTYPISTQKMKKVIPENTLNMKIDVAGVDPKKDDANFAKRMQSFLDSFDEGDWESEIGRLQEGEE